MSRIGKNPVAVLEGVTVNVEGQTVKAKGPKGELQVVVHDDVSVKMVDGKVQLEQRVNSLRAKKLWPTCPKKEDEALLKPGMDLSSS